MPNRIARKSRIETLETSLRVQFSSFLESRIGIWSEDEVGRAFKAFSFFEIAKLQARVEELERQCQAKNK